MLKTLSEDMNSVKEGLDSADPMIRFHAARLSRNFSYKFEKELLYLLNDPFHEVVSQSCRSLAKMQSQDALPLIIKLLSHVSEECRYSAASSLGHYFEQSTPILPLLYSLKDLSRETRRIAIISLNKFNKIEVENKVRELYNDIQKSDVLQETTNQISNLETLRGVFSALVSLRGDWISNFVQVGFDFPDEEIQRFCLIASGAHRFTEHILNIQPYLNSSDDETRLAAVNAIFSFEDKKFQKYLHQFVNDPFEWIRHTVAREVRQYPVKENIQILEKLIVDENVSIRKMSVSTLKHFKFEQVVKLFTKVINDTNSYVRQAVAKSLEQFQNPQAKELIETLLIDPDDLVRINAQNTLNSRKSNKSNP